MKYIFTNRARKQLDEITYYIAQDNPLAAERVYEKILDTCEMIVDLPSVGRNPSYLNDKNILSVSVKKYNDYQIFYRIRKNGVVILWIFHGARDIPALIGD